MKGVRWGWPFSRFDPLLLAAAALVVLAPALSVREALWVEHLDPVPAFAAGGMLVAFLAARTRISAFSAHLAATALGLELLLLVFDNAVSGTSFAVRLDVLETRMAVWLNTVLAGGAGTDTLIFALAMAALAWLVGYAAGWLVFRTRAPWLAIASAGLALMINLSYAPPALSSFVVLFVAASGALLIVHQAAERAALWSHFQVVVDRFLAPRLMATASITGAALLSLAWVIPPGGSDPSVSAAWNQVLAPWTTFQNGFDRLFASINGSQQTPHGLNFGRTIAPRGSFDLSDTPVLRIKSPQPLYWRATTADRYTGQAMTSGATSEIPLAPGASVPDATRPADREDVTSQVTILASRSAVLFVPDHPLSLSVPAQIDVRRSPDDIALIRPLGIVAQNQDYTVISAVPRVPADALRAAGQDYPEWVHQEYLQLPRELPRRVVVATRQIVGGAASPFDRAAAIESYLRGSFTYSTHVPPVPAGRDWVDYLLFDAREAYCDYFAVGMTVMLRTQGIPARVASGFAPGEFDPATGTWTVRESHAHSWVEVYFPNYGWITFEPSSLRQLPNRPADAAALANPTPTSEPTATGLTPAEQQAAQQTMPETNSGGAAAVAQLIPPWTGPIAVLLLVLTLAFLLVRIAWRRGIAGLPTFQQPYAELVRLSRWVGGVRSGVQETPYEVARGLSAHAPAAGDTLRGLAHAYVEGTYGGRPPTSNPLPAWWAVRSSVIRRLLERRGWALLARLTRWVPRWRA